MVGLGIERGGERDDYTKFAINGAVAWKDPDQIAGASRIITCVLWGTGIITLSERNVKCELGS